MLWDSVTAVTVSHLTSHFFALKWWDFAQNAQICLIFNKVTFYYFWLTMGMGEMDTGTIEQNGLGILGKTPPFQGKKVWHCDSCHTVPSQIITFGSFSNAINHLLLWHVSHNNLFTLLMDLWNQKLSKHIFWNCDTLTAVTLSHFKIFFVVIYLLMLQC